MKLRTILIGVISFAALAVGTAPRAKQSPKLINITASRFAFEPNEITVKKGEEVTLVIQSNDVTHGLLVEDLGVRTEVKKGQASTVTFTPETAGTFEGKCAHFCGTGHGSMTFTVQVVDSGAR
jgi:cytochrome c oxidase subunit 2